MQLTALPDSTRRLFPSHDAAGLDPKLGERGGRSLVIGRLLEDGDGRDLRWLVEAVSEEELAAWLGRHGERQLSRRSLAFWRRVLEPGPEAARTGDAAAAVRRQIWPL
jgi:hypothetical protein